MNKPFDFVYCRYFRSNQLRLTNQEKVGVNTGLVCGIPCCVHKGAKIYNERYYRKKSDDQHLQC
jgi:hypothetical protein